MIRLTTYIKLILVTSLILHILPRRKWRLQDEYSIPHKKSHMYPSSLYTLESFWTAYLHVTTSERGFRTTDVFYNSTGQYKFS